MSFATSADDNIPSPAECSGFQQITDDNVKEFTSPATREMLRSQANGPSEGFGVWKEPGIPAGYLRVLYKGSAIGRYRVRNIDAFIVNVFVNAEFRRKGYGEYLLRKTLRYLHTHKHIHTAYLTVRVNNLPARRLYAKAGGVDLRTIKRLRLFNVPIVLRLQTL